MQNFQIVFKPWIGKNYGSGIFKKKIIILGESHYCCEPGTCDGCVEQTIEIIKKQIDDTRQDFEHNPFYTKIAKLFLEKKAGEYISLKEKISFWESVIFYNYVQGSVGKSARIAPSTEMWNISFEPFKNLMENYQPDFLLILGVRLWDNMPGTGGIEWPNGKLNGTYYYLGNNKKTLCFNIDHPSSSYFTYETTPLLSEVLSCI